MSWSSTFSIVTLPFSPHKPLPAFFLSHTHFLTCDKIWFDILPWEWQFFKLHFIWLWGRGEYTVWFYIHEHFCFIHCFFYISIYCWKKRVHSSMWIIFLRRVFITFIWSIFLFACWNYFHFSATVCAFFCLLLIQYYFFNLNLFNLTHL